MRMIAITGLANSGKDTVADYLVSTHGYNKVSFATPIKNALNAIFGWNMKMWDDRKWKETVLADYGKSPRQMAQLLGTEWGRDLITPNLWTIIAMKQAEKTGKTVVSDLRFLNEARFIKLYGGTIIKITRPGIAKMQHVSEDMPFEDIIDYEIMNDASIPQLKKKLEATLGHLF